MIWAIVVAAGGGERFGSAKQFERLGTRRVVDWAVDGARSVADGVVLVMPPGVPADSVPPGVPADSVPPGVPADGVPAGEPPGEPVLPYGADADVVVPGGATRSASVRAGLAAVPEPATIIVVHDAARPLAPPALFHAVVDAVNRGADGAVPGLPVTDTLKRVAGTTVVGTVDRGGLVAVQTPQAFRAAALRRAHGGGHDASDDAALVEAVGGRVVIVPGDPANLKLTLAADLVAARARLDAGAVGTGLEAGERRGR